MNEIDFKSINPRQGSKHASFEELCCQLARRDCDNPLIRLDGSGGDGGIECYSDSETGRVAWQAKYVFDIDRLLRQAELSLRQAKINHPQLKRFILCFPFDLTGPTSRKGKSGSEKFERWRDKQTQLAADDGLNLTIEAWPAFEIRRLLFKYDKSGGINEYFFGKITLDNGWFNDHIEQAIATAGPRYTPELNVQTEVSKWFNAFSRDDAWSSELEGKINDFARIVQDKYLWNSFRLPDNPNHETPSWPGDTRELTDSVLSSFDQIIESLRCFTTTEVEKYETIILKLAESISKLRSIETKLSLDIEERHGKGAANSPNWRQFMAERMATFPAANLDSIRNLLESAENLLNWFESPACSLAFRKSFILRGEAGIGKTHTICDVAKRRQETELRTCIVFGHEFRDQPVPWVRVAESIGFSSYIGTDQMLDFLNSAGEATGFPLLICIDAINDTIPRSYWKSHLTSMSRKIRQRDFLRICFVCRDAYLTRCLPDESRELVVPHPGFGNNVRLACQQYFEHFNIQPPISPYLQPELSNPLYLRLFCKALNDRGIDSVPPGWSGSGSIIIDEFLKQKAIKFADEFETASPDASTRCLQIFAKEIVATENHLISWDKAKSLINKIVPDADATINWLIGEELLIEDCTENKVLGNQIAVRLAFERLGDYLIAKAFLENIYDEFPDELCKFRESLQEWLMDRETIESNRGMLTELSALIAEQNSGMELTDLIDDIDVKEELREIVIQALAYRTPESFTNSTVGLLCSTMQERGLKFEDFDAILACSWRNSAIDAIWLDKLLRHYASADLDAFLSCYLHDRFQPGTVVFNIIFAVRELPLKNISTDLAERWVIVLLWFTAAADRRIKDGATRSATKILTKFTSIIPLIIERFIDNYDEEIRERMLLSCYGALLLALDIEIIKMVALRLNELYMTQPSKFSNAIIRDHIRSICELAIEVSINGLREEIKPESITTTKATHDWPLRLPDDDEVENWGKLVHFWPDEFVSDFFKYSMNSLNPWSHEFSKENMGKWILQRVACDFSYIDSKCSEYDYFMLSKYGGGRGKPVWAERIAKKYLWISLYQLASRLNDHLERHFQPWRKCLPRTPLILLEQRKLDPTIPERTSADVANKQIWNFPTPCKLDRPLESGFDDWMKWEEPLQLEDLLQTKPHEGFLFIPLVAYLSHKGVEYEHSKFSGIHRRVWIHLQSYLVPQKDIDYAYESLHERNNFGQWLPRSAEFGYGFVGEYPWSTVYDLSSCEQSEDVLPIQFDPTWNEINCSWEYDTTEIPQNVLVPSKRFFDGKLRWDGNGGFSYSSDLLAFLDPSVSSSDPPALLVNVDFLDEFLKTNQMGVVWTLVGEKMNMDYANLNQENSIPPYTFSQVGYRHSSTNFFGEVVEFDIYQDSMGQY